VLVLVVKWSKRAIIYGRKEKENCYFAIA